MTRLDPSLEATMTFGVYQPATPARPKGVFHFNGANLTRQTLIGLGSLTFHELMPGHHFHLASQAENPDLHPLRKMAFVSAFAEGWAEYAATLAGEAGLYDSYDRYGRLMMEAFLVSRLIVDTGMNAKGWSLDEARDFLRLNTFLSETEIRSETLRYACDIPGQSLAYKMGDAFLMTMREQMRRALGQRFHIKAFHAAILRPGALPLRDVAFHLEHEIARLQAEP